MFNETSAKENINIEESFTQIARAIKKKLEAKVVVAPTSAPAAKAVDMSQPSAPAAAKKGWCALL